MGLTKEDKAFITAQIAAIDASRDLAELRAEIAALKEDNAKLKRQLLDISGATKSVAEAAAQATDIANRALAEARAAKIENDNLQQYGRRASVRVEGIQFVEGESPQDLRKKVKDCLSKLDIVLKDSDIYRMHRSSKPKHDEFNPKRGLVAQTLIKLNSWEVREKLHKANGIARQRKAPIRVNHDLTKKRYNLLAKAKSLFSKKMATLFTKEELEDIADSQNCFAYANLNSDLRVRVRGNVISFETEDELYRIYRDTFDEPAPGTEA